MKQLDINEHLYSMDKVLTDYMGGTRPTNRGYYLACHKSSRAVPLSQTLEGVLNMYSRHVTGAYRYLIWKDEIEHFKEYYGFTIK